MGLGETLRLKTTKSNFSVIYVVCLHYHFPNDYSFVWFKFVVCWCANNKKPTTNGERRSQQKAVRALFDFKRSYIKRPAKWKAPSTCSFGVSRRDFSINASSDFEKVHILERVIQVLRVVQCCCPSDILLFVPLS